ncbi:MAG: NRDE family protein, partial [Candidatus Sericytochromatia bacterium]
PLHAWETQPEIYAGEDQQQHGTWLGLTAQARLAAVTNLRLPADPGSGERSRGWLVRDFLLSRRSPADYLDHVQAEAQQYHGFNLLVGNVRTLMYTSNQPGAQPRLLTPGIYGVSNAGLNTPWPKVEEAKVEFTRLLARREPDIDAMMALMASRTRYPLPLLPDTGIGQAKEQALSSIFVSTEEFGTRSTTLMSWHRQGGARMLERSYARDGSTRDTEIDLTLQPA